MLRHDEDACDGCPQNKDIDIDTDIDDETFEYIEYARSLIEKWQKHKLNLPVRFRDFESRWMLLIEIEYQKRQRELRKKQEAQMRRQKT